MFDSICVATTQRSTSKLSAPATQSFVIMKDNQVTPYFKEKPQKEKALNLVNSRLLAKNSIMPMTGVEPVRCHHRQILSLVRLPIPPHRLVETNEDYYITALIFCQDYFIKIYIVYRIFLTIL